MEIVSTNLTMQCDGDQTSGWSVVASKSFKLARNNFAGSHELVSGTNLRFPLMNSTRCFKRESEKIIFTRFFFIKDKELDIEAAVRNKKADEAK